MLESGHNNISGKLLIPKIAVATKLGTTPLADNSSFELNMTS